MSGRGTFAIGNNVDHTYESIDKIEGIKVLSGKNGLSEESYSSTAYIKLKPGGTFHEMRIYDGTLTVAEPLILKNVDYIIYCMYMII